MLPLQEHWLCRPVGFSSAVLPLLDRKNADPIPFTFQRNTDFNSSSGPVLKVYFGE